MSFLDKIFGDPSKKFLRKSQPIIDKINNLESEFEKLADLELREKTFQLKERLKKGETLDDILPEAFALTRESAKRTLGQRHFDVQLIGGLALHQGKIAEMATGEGKTLTATLALYLNALEGKGCHLVTVNDYLAKRDTVWMGQIYHLLGLSVGCIVHGQAFIYDPSYKLENQRDKERDILGSFKVIESYLKPVPRKEAYLADITYGTNNEFGFDFLRDNMVYDLNQIVQRGHHFAIIDEVDSILIDEARTPLIISQPDAEAAEMYREFAKIIPNLKEGRDYNIDEKMKVVTLTEEGISRIEKTIGVDNIYEAKGMRYLHYLEQALKAQVLFKRDRDYVVKNGQVIIVDEFTGRLLFGRRYSEGLHQAIEAKEGLEVQPESKTLATITFQNYFRMYKKLAGMTGTALTSAEEFDKVYNLEVVVIPTNKPLNRNNLPDKILKTEKAKFKMIVEEVKKRHQKGQPVLIGTTSIEKNEYLSKLLSKEGISHQVLNAKNHEREGEIIAQAGKLKAVTCATNMAGRGVDIILGGNPQNKEEAEKVKKLGGLFVLGTERHEARRIDNQLRGRAGRQGDPGASQFFISLEDDLMRIFGGEKIKTLMEKFNFPETEPIELKIVSKAIEEAQSKIEGINLDIRKHLLEYDEVLTKHREVFYKKRRQILEKESIKPEIFSAFEKEIKKIIEFHCLGDYPKEWNIEEIFEEAKTILSLGDKVHSKLREISEKQRSPQILREEILNYFKNLWQLQYNAKEEELGKERMRTIEKFIALRIIDFLWVDHLTMMDHLRDSVRLRVYGQRDPLVEYKTEGHRMFSRFLANFESNLIKNILKVGITKTLATEKEKAFYSQNKLSQFAKPFEKVFPQQKRNYNFTKQKISFAKVGRNDPCPCGSGKKYKKCCLLKQYK
jgi:preprotein translocase subunit SecA